MNKRETAAWLAVAGIAVFLLVLAIAVMPSK